MRRGCSTSWSEQGPQVFRIQGAFHTNCSSTKSARTRTERACCAGQVNSPKCQALRETALLLSLQVCFRPQAGRLQRPRCATCLADARQVKAARQAAVAAPVTAGLEFGTANVTPVDRYSQRGCGVCFANVVQPSVASRTLRLLGSTSPGFPPKLLARPRAGRNDACQEAGEALGEQLLQTYLRGGLAAGHSCIQRRPAPAGTGWARFRLTGVGGVVVKGQMGQGHRSTGTAKLAV